MKLSFPKVLSSLMILSLFSGSCQTNESQAPKETDNNNYFLSSEEGVRTGGVKVIPIETPKGRFNVWTKRFGNNPRIRLLLLNGGPGATHEYIECFESYLPAEQIEFIY